MIVKDADYENANVIQVTYKVKSYRKNIKSVCYFQ